MGHTRNYSEDVAAVVDEETKRLLATAHQEAFDILEENRDVLDSLVLALMEQETLDKRRGRRDLRAAAPPSGASRGPGPRPGAVADPAGRGAQVRRQRLRPEETQGAVILTPPGSGGDVHGDPTVNS